MSMSGELPDGTECSIWRIRNDFFNYNVVLKYFNQNDSSLFKIYGISCQIDGVYVIVSECVRCSLVEWIALHPPLTNQEPDLNLFLYPLRTLFDSIIAIRNNNICPDFELKKKDVFVIQTGSIVKFKVGFILPLERYSKLQCLNSTSRIARSWFSDHGARIPLNISFLLNLMIKYNFVDDSQLKMLRLHPIFYEGDKKEFVFDFVIKVQRIMRNKLLSGGLPRNVFTSLQTAFTFMNINVHARSPWYVRVGDKRSQPMSQCLGHASFQNVIGISMITNIRNIVTHFSEFSPLPHLAQVCCDELEKMWPGCWSAIFFLAIDGMSEYFHDD